jgi:hypothetical protein
MLPKYGSRSDPLWDTRGRLLLSAILKRSLKREPKHLGYLAANLNPSDTGDIVELPTKL